MADDQKPALHTLAWELLRVGASSFGGFGATLRLLQRNLVDRRHWLQVGDISEALAFTQALPGSAGMKVVAYLGWKLRGWPGTLIAATAFIAPAATSMILVAAGSFALRDQPWIGGVLTGIQVGVVGLIAAAMRRLAITAAKGPILTAVLLGGCVLGFFVHAVVVVMVGGLIGALFNRRHCDD